MNDTKFADDLPWCRYTFDSFVVAPQNAAAVSAAKSVARNPGERYNPLVIRSRIGEGKTHLLRAIGHATRLLHPGMGVGCFTGESFARQLSIATTTACLPAFRASCRALDVLLLDDLQFHKEPVRAELADLWRALLQNGKQLVLAADSDTEIPPALLSSTAFTVEIKTVDVATRKSILVRMAARQRVALPEEVADYLAVLTGNVRELEGLMVRLAAYARLVETDISLSLALFLARRESEANCCVRKGRKKKSRRRAGGGFCQKLIQKKRRSSPS